MFLVQQKLVSIVTLLLLCTFVYAENKKEDCKITGAPFIKNYKASEYGQFAQNWDIEQDARGFLYFGNQFGLMRFDGLKWDLIKTSNDGPVNSLSLSNDGKLFIGSTGEIGYIDTNSTTKPEYVSLTSKLAKKDRNFRNVWQTLSALDGSYFFTQKKIFYYSNGNMTVLEKDIAPFFSRKIFGKIFVVNQKREIFILNRTSFIKLPYTEHIRKHILNILILPFMNDRLLIATGSGKFFIYDLSLIFNLDTNQLNTKEYKPESVIKEFKTDAAEYVKNRTNILYSGIRLKCKHYALNTCRGGIIIFSSEGKVVNIINKKTGINTNSVWKLFQDREGNMWAALNNGLSRIDTTSPVTHFNTEKGIDEYVTRITKYKNHIYVGTFNGIFRHDLNSNAGDFTKVSRYRGDCWDFMDFNGILLFGGAAGIGQIIDGSIYRLHWTPGLYTMGLNNKFPGYIFLGKNDGLEAIRLKKKGNKLEAEKETRIRFSNLPYTIRKITSDSSNNLWLTTSYNGLIMLKFNSDKPSDYTVYKYGTEQGLPSLSSNLFNIIDKEILISTSKGIYETWYEKKSDEGNPAQIRFRECSRFSGIFKNLEDKNSSILSLNGKIYIKTSDDFGVWEKNDQGKFHLNSKPFKRITGFIEYMYIEDNGDCWFAGPDGLLRFNSNYPKNYELPFNTEIRSFRVNDKKDSVDLSTIPAFSKVSIDFVSLFFEEVEMNQYSSMLEGYEQNWSPWSRSNHKEYFRLPHGTYTFKVRSKNIYKQISSTASMTFSILPPWYRTTLAYIIYALILILTGVAAFLLYRRHISNIISRERKRYEIPEDVSQNHLDKLINSMEVDKEYLSTNLSVNTLGEKLNIPGYQLSLIINRELGSNFYEFVNKYRIAEAKRLLIDPASSDLSILNISYKVGFNTKSTFNNAFKKYTGCTPIQYKKKYISENRTD